MSEPMAILAHEVISSKQRIKFMKILAMLAAMTMLLATSSSFAKVKHVSVEGKARQEKAGANLVWLVRGNLLEATSGIDAKIAENVAQEGFAATAPPHIDIPI